jgi:hypothetical protein
MTLRGIYFGYMALVGLAAGAILIAAPAVSQFWLKPYFWVLIAVLLFDIGVAIVLKKSPGTLLSMNARLLGFAIGMALMVAIPSIAGAPVRFF